jgi:hypothetical protein
MAEPRTTPAVGRPAPEGRLRIVRKHQPWSTLTRRVDVAVDGVLIGEVDQGEVVEGSVGAGSHELGVRPGRHGGWQTTTVCLEPGANRGVLVSMVERRRIWRTLSYLGLATLFGGTAIEAGDPDVRFQDLDSVDAGRPGNVTAVLWLVLAGVVAAVFLLDPVLAMLVALIGLITVFGARLQAGARRSLRRPEVLPPWTRARLLPR